MFRRRNMKTWVRFFLLVVLLVGVTGTSLALINAYEHKTKAEVSGKGKIKGVRGYVRWSNPDLNGGKGSYHRIVIENTTTNRYIETGWVKESSSQRTGFFHLVIFGIPNQPPGQPNTQWYNAAPVGTYEYVIEHVKFYGINYHRIVARDSLGVETELGLVWREDANGLGNNTGHRMAFGGEVNSHVEEMVGPGFNVPFPPYNYEGTLYYGIRWLRKEKDTGNLIWKEFKNPDGNWNAIVYPPYWSNYLGYNSFGGMVQTCGRIVTNDCLLPLP